MLAWSNVFRPRRTIHFRRQQSVPNCYLKINRSTACSLYLHAQLWWIDVFRHSYQIRFLNFVYSTIARTTSNSSNEFNFLRLQNYKTQLIFIDASRSPTQWQDYLFSSNFVNLYDTEKLGNIQFSYLCRIDSLSQLCCCRSSLSPWFRSCFKQQRTSFSHLTNLSPQEIPGKQFDVLPPFLER